MKRQPLGAVLAASLIALASFSVHADELPVTKQTPEQKQAELDKRKAREARSAERKASRKAAKVAKADAAPAKAPAP